MRTILVCVAALVLATAMLVAQTGTNAKPASGTSKPADSKGSKRGAKGAAVIDELAKLYEAREFTGAGGGKLLYRIMKPDNYDKSQKYPLVLGLHGSGGRGDDNTGQLAGASCTAELSTPAMRAKNPCFIVLPQCPAGKQWVDAPWGKGSYSTASVKVSESMALVMELLTALKKEFSIDESRLYVTGQSMGGFGTWDLIVRNPKMFAAAIPVCGAGDPSKATDIAQVPIWAFHGDKDPVVPVRGTREMMDALRKANAACAYCTEFAGGNHLIWGRAYATDGLWDWMFSQKLGQKPVASRPAKP